MNKIQPISGNILIEPIVQETAWSTSQDTYEERGKVISCSFVKTEIHPIEEGNIVYFDSWQAARFKDGEGKDIWLVHIDAVRAVEKNEPQISE